MLGMSGQYLTRNLTINMKQIQAYTLSILTLCLLLLNGAMAGQCCATLSDDRVELEFTSSDLEPCHGSTHLDSDKQIDSCTDCADCCVYAVLSSKINDKTHCEHRQKTSVVLSANEFFPLLASPPPKI